MNERQIIQNYIRDNYYSVHPGYYVWKKPFYFEWVYTQWACDDILDEIYNHPQISPRLVLEHYQKRAELYYKIAKTERGKNIFGKAVSIAEELEGLFL